MKPISTYVHGMLDYAMGVLLILLPFWLGLDSGSPEHRVMLFSGVAVILYSLITDYELGVTGIISMRGHLTIDFLMGLFMAASPWILGFSGVIFLPHLILGVLEIGAAALTDSHPIKVH